MLTKMLTSQPNGSVDTNNNYVDINNSNLKGSKEKVQLIPRIMARKSTSKEHASIGQCNIQVIIHTRKLLIFSL